MAILGLISADLAIFQNIVAISGVILANDWLKYWATKLQSSYLYESAFVCVFLNGLLNSFDRRRIYLHNKGDYFRARSICMNHGARRGSAPWHEPM